jgi:hypothetical protein
LRGTGAFLDAFTPSKTAAISWPIENLARTSDEVEVKVQNDVAEATDFGRVRVSIISSEGHNTPRAAIPHRKTAKNVANLEKSSME